ncbi:MAG TPA: RNA methyltransferase [Bacteroidetes bacterium]|nr:RNA methyltransferase [Bacteroidota bacterium]
MNLNVKITSVHNKKILALRKLYKSRERKASDVFIAEGKKEVQRGILSGFELEKLYYCPTIFKNDLNDIDKLDFEKVDIYELDKSVYEKIAYRDNTEGILALFKKKTYGFDDIASDSKNLYIVLEAVEKPGNLGAVLRTADAAGITGIIMTNTKVDQYHPNVIRSSLGAVFTVPVVVSTNEDALRFFKENNIKIYSAALPSYKNLYELDLNQPVAMVFGTESNGLTDFWLQNNDENYTIPMNGIVDSLNVSTSVAISIYEVLRQRGI